MIQILELNSLTIDKIYYDHDLGFLKSDLVSSNNSKQLTAIGGYGAIVVFDLETKKTIGTYSFDQAFGNRVLKKEDGMFVIEMVWVDVYHASRRYIQFYSMTIQ